MVTLSSVEKDSIANTRDSFKDCILARKVRNQMDKYLEKRKVPQAVSGNFVQKWLFCKIYALYNICYFICGQSSETHVRSSSYLLWVFFK